MTIALILLAAASLLLLAALLAMHAKYQALKQSVETGKMKMYDRLKDSEEDKNRLKRQLTQNIAHELKTPVSSISGYLETLVSDKEIDPKTRDLFIDRCYSQAKRLSALVQDISTLNRLDDAPQSFTSERIDIPVLLQTIQKDVALQLSEHKMRFLALVDPDVMVEGDLGLVYSIFRNLTDNSIAYAGDGSVITVKIDSETPTQYNFVFADNGAGVPLEHLPHLFERFYRVDKGRSRKLGGTGLGLAIVKNAVLLHGGTITARIGQAGGLELAFSLPKARPE